MSVVVVGSVAYDGVETPHGKVDRMLGGAATYIALAAIVVVYAGASWAMAVHAGSAHVTAAAGQQGPGLLFGLAGNGFLAQVAPWLFATSLFAAALAFHNCVWRYAFALGRENVLPSVLGRTGANSIPKAASLAQSATGLAAIAGTALSGWSPMGGLFFALVISSPRRSVLNV